MQGSVKFVSPIQLKRQVEGCNDMFAGFAQHDADELLNTLLDALSESVNRVKNKLSLEVSCC